MRSPLRIIAFLLGIFFVLQSAGWILNPANAASGLGMPLLDGLARSTQIGDLSAFFLTAGVTILLGCRRGSARLLLVPAGMIGGAAVLRIVAWALHGADFATLFIAIEIVTTAILLAAAQRLSAEASI